MRIKILGTRGEIKPTLPKHSKHSGVLIDNKILFDLGEREYLKYRPKAIFITHLHPDHAFFILKPEEAKIEIPIYAPEKIKNGPEINIINKKIKIDDYAITPIPTHHSKLVNSVAYLIEKKPNKILYTGDVIWINKEYHYLLQDLDLVITEASFIRKGGMIRRDKTGKLYGHGGIPNLIGLFSPFTKNILFMHFGSWFYKDAKKAEQNIAKLGEENKIKTIIGYDGMEIDLETIKGS
jgi:ribonuclease BN (tRNA processing enzyme)